jgi:hypothetical protein
MKSRACPVDALDLQSDELSTYLDRRTGELVTLSDEETRAAEDEEGDPGGYPEWELEMIEKAREVLASDDFLPLPGRFEIHEYRIMEDFCSSVEDDEVRETLWDGIQGRGAFRRFREVIREYEIEEEWYRFRQEAFEEIAISWLEANGIPFTREKISP